MYVTSKLIMKKTRILLDEYGNYLDESYNEIKFDEIEQQEIKDAQDTLKKYHSFISQEEYYQTIDELNQTSRSYDKLTNIVGISSILGLLWSVVVLYLLYFENNVSQAILFSLMVTAILVILLYTFTKAGRWKL